MNQITQSNLILSEPQPMDQNPAAVYIASLPARTGQRTQAQALRVIAGILGGDLVTLDWGKLRYQHTNAIRARLMERYAPATANKMLSALRQALRHARRLGQISGDDYDAAIDLDPITGETLPAGRELSQGEILALMNACAADASPAGTRDAAVIGIMYAAGLRRDEVVKIDLADLDPDTGVLIVHGKRHKDRTAHITNGALEAIKDWLSLRGSSDGALFVEVRGKRILAERETVTLTKGKNAGKVIERGGRMSSQSIYNLLAKRAQEANIKSFSPHDVRRTFVSDLLDRGADIATVSKMAGHANVQTTARYDRRPEEAKRKAASLLNVPYKSRTIGA